MEQATTLLFLEDTYRFTAHAEILAVQREDEQRDAVILDQTIFYPQGGGQPYDTGVIYNAHGTFDVEEVHLRDGVVHHIGRHRDHQLSGSVTLEINAERRMRNARYHTCGHLIDYALHDIGYTSWKPIKGYHFPEGAYVAYTPDERVDLSQHPELASKLEQALNARIAAGRVVEPKLVSRDELSQYVAHIPDYIPTDKPCRIVVYDGHGVPCGGTHVRDVQEIGSATIRKVGKKKGDIKIAYDVA